MAARASIFDEPGRYREVRASTSKMSGRVGSTGRTMHARVTSITRANGGAPRAAGSLDYDARIGRHRSRADELETEGGTDRKEMSRALQASEEATSRKNGVVARRIIAELPAEMDADARRVVAERVAAWFIERGHPTHWAVHSHNGKGEYQPHLHMTVVARRCWLEGDVWKAALAGRSGVAGGGGEKPVLAGPAALQHWRRAVMAATINAVAAERGIQLATAWHGGRLAETGINRPPKRRRPEVALRAPDRSWTDDNGLGAINAAIDAGDEATVRATRAAYVEQQRQVVAERRRTKAAATAARGEVRATEAELRAAAALAELAKVEALRAMDALKHRDERDELQQKLEATIEAERAKPTVKPATTKQRETVIEVAKRMGLDLPEGWDVSTGSAGLAIRLVKKVLEVQKGARAAQEAAQREMAARRAAEADRDQAQEAARIAQEAAEAERLVARAAAEREAIQARLEAAAATSRPPVVRDVVRETVPAPVSQQPTTTSPKLSPLLVPANDAKEVAETRKTLQAQANETLKRQELTQISAIRLLWGAHLKLDPERAAAERQIMQALALVREEMAMRAMAIPTDGQKLEAEFRADLAKRQREANPQGKGHSRG